MAVSVMQVGIMDMFVLHRLMPVPVRMWLGYRPIVLVPMVLVMHMAVLVFHRLMSMFMLMAFGQMQPEAKAHQEPGDHELRRQRFMKQDKRDDRSNERRNREI